MNIFVLFVPQSVYIVQNTTFTDVFGSTTLAIINFLKHKHVHGAARHKLQESIRSLIRYWHSKFGWLVGYFLYLYPHKNVYMRGFYDFPTSGKVSVICPFFHIDWNFVSLNFPSWSTQSYYQCPVWQCYVKSIWYGAMSKDLSDKIIRDDSCHW